MYPRTASRRGRGRDAGITISACIQVLHLHLQCSPCTCTCNENMPIDEPPPRATLAVKRMPKTTPHPPARAPRTAHGSRCGKRPSPHLRIPVITRSIACSRAPHATQRALSAHTQARSQPQPTVDRATGTAVQLYRSAAADPQPVSTTARAAGSPSAPRRERQVERLPHVVAGDVDVDIVWPHGVRVDAWLRIPLKGAHGEG